MIYFHSYSINDFEILDFIKEFPNNNPNDIIEYAFNHIIDDYPSDNDKEFLVGVVIYFLYQGHSIDKTYLQITLKIIEELLSKSQFNSWNNKEKRILFLNNEKIRVKKAIKYNNIEPIELKLKKIDLK
jgi:hypothetical protein